MAPSPTSERLTRVRILSSSQQGPRPGGASESPPTRLVRTEKGLAARVQGEGRYPAAPLLDFHFSFWILTHAWLPCRRARALGSGPDFNSNRRAIPRASPSDQGQGIDNIPRGPYRVTNLAMSLLYLVKR